MNNLKLWTYDQDDGDYFVAESAERADALMAKEFGWTLAEFNKREMMKCVWVAMPGDKDIAIDFEEPTLGLEAGKHTKTAAEWCALAGEGYLYSMNY